MPTAEWLKIVYVSLSVFLAMGLGATLRRVGWLTTAADDSLIKLVIRVLMPCLIFRVVVDNDSLRALANLAVPPVVGFSLCTAGILVAALVARFAPRLTGLTTPAQRRTFAACAGIFNYGFISIPLVQALFNDNNATLGVLFVHNVGVDLAIWTVGLLVISGSLGTGWWRRLINPPSVTIVVALAMNLLGVRPAMLGPIWSTIELLSHAAIPTSLLLVGATIGEELGTAHDDHNRGQTTRIIAWAIFLRLALLPVGFLLFAASVPLSDELTRVVIIQAAQPSAMFPIIIAREYGGDSGTAVRVVLGTQVIALATMPLWIGAGLAWFGLW
jgi:hypothetical protein